MSEVNVNNVPESPQKQKSEKQIKSEKRKKLKAFQSFLQKNQSPGGLELINKGNQSQQQQKLEKVQGFDQTLCTVCQIQLGDRKKTCGFCNEPACVQHMRKKRKSKETHKFVKICDKCQDEFLFGKYMKFQLKNQQSIAAQESIVQAKRNQLDMQIKGRKTKLMLLYHKQNQILGRKKQQDTRFGGQDNQMRIKFEKLQKKQRQLNQLQQTVKQIQAKLPPSFQDDYHALQIQNDKVNTELLKYEKACNEAIKTKSRRQRQVYEQYNIWQQEQRSKMTKKQDQCYIF